MEQDQKTSLRLLLQNRSLIPVYRLYCCALRLEDYVDLYLELTQLLDKFSGSAQLENVQSARRICSKYFADESIKRVDINPDIISAVTTPLENNQIPVDELKRIQQIILDILKDQTFVSFTESNPYLTFLKGEKALRQCVTEPKKPTKEETDNLLQALKVSQACISNIQATSQRTMDSKVSQKSGLTLGGTYSQYAKQLPQDHPLAETTKNLGDRLQSLEEMQNESAKLLAKRLEGPLSKLMKNELVTCQSQKKKYEAKKQPTEQLIQETYLVLSDCSQKCETQILKSMCETFEEQYQLIDHSLKLMRQILPAMMEYRTKIELADLQIEGGYQIGSRVEVPESEIIVQGSMEKKGAKRRNWNERWFVLKQRHLLYFSNVDLELKGAIYLQNCTIDAAFHKKKPHCFAIQTSLRTYILCPQSEQEMKRWMSAIRNATVESELKQKSEKERKELESLVDSQASDYIDSFLSERNAPSNSPELKTSSSSVNSDKKGSEFSREKLLQQLDNDQPEPPPANNPSGEKLSDLTPPLEPAPVPEKQPTQTKQEDSESDDYDVSDETESDETNFNVVAEPPKRKSRKPKKKKKKSKPKSSTEATKAQDNRSMFSGSFSTASIERASVDNRSKDLDAFIDEDSQPDDGSDVDSSVPPSEPGETPGPTRSPNILVKQGYLTKKGAKRRNWNTRWFILKHNHLAYYKNPGDREPKGVIILSNCKVELSEKVKRTHCFSITAPLRTYYIHAKNSTTQEEWMSAIRSCIPN